MRTTLTLAKAVLVDGLALSHKKYGDYFYDDLGLFMFFSEASYNTITGEFRGRRLMHDRIVEQFDIPTSLPEKSFNYLTVDVIDLSANKEQTKMYFLKNGLKLTGKQIEWLKNFFDVG